MATSLESIEVFIVRLCTTSHSSFSKMNRFSWNSMNWTESPKCENGSIIASHKHRRHSRVVIKVPD